MESNEDPDKNPYMKGHLIFFSSVSLVGFNFLKRPEIYIGKRTAYSTNIAGPAGCQHVKEGKIDSYLSPCTNLNSKWNKVFKIKPNILNQIEQRVGNSLELIGTEKTI